MLQSKGQQAVQQHIRHGRIRCVAVQPLPPFIEVPIPLPSRKGQHQPLFHGMPLFHPSRESLRHGHQLRPYLPQELPVTAVVQIFPALRDIMQGKRRNHEVHLNGITDRQQAVLPPVFGHQFQGGPGETVLPEGIIAAEHLVAAVHGIQGLLPPGAVLIMLMHAQVQGLHAHIVNLLLERIQTGPLPLRQHIHGRRDSKLLHRHGLLGADLQIAAAQPAERIAVHVAPLLRPVEDAEVPAADDPPHPPVLHMFPIGDGDILGTGRIQLQAQEPHLLAAQVIDYGVIINPCALHPIHIRQKNKLVNGPETQWQLLLHRRRRTEIRKLPRHPAVLPGGVIAVAQPQLAGDDMHPVVQVCPAHAGEGLPAAPAQYPFLPCQLIEQPRAAPVIGGGGADAIVPHHDGQAVLPLPAHIRNVHLVIHLVIGEIRILPPRRQLSVHIGGIIAVRRDAQHRPPGLIGKAVHELPVLVRPGAVIAPDPFRSVKYTLHIDSFPLRPPQTPGYPAWDGCALLPPSVAGAIFRKSPAPTVPAGLCVRPTESVFLTNFR